jgi:GGDEF domain-containing protein
VHHRDATITVQANDLQPTSPRSARRRWAEALGWRQAPRPDRILSSFLASVGNATRREEIHDLLLRASRALTSAPRVEVRPLGGPTRVMVSRSSPTPGAEVRLPIRYRGELVGTLLVFPRGRTLPSATLTSLESLCSIAAIGDRLIGREPMLRVADPSLPESRLRSRALLLPILRQLILLARRRREPISILAIGLDRPQPAIETIVSVEHLEAIDPAIAATLGTLRESDLIVHQDSRTLVAVLPNASIRNASIIAEAIIRAVTEAMDPEPAPGLAIGVVGLSDELREADVLLDVAVEALRRARLNAESPIIVADQGSFTPHLLPEGGASMAG